MMSLKAKIVKGGPYGMELISDLLQFFLIVIFFTDF